MNFSKIRFLVIAVFCLYLFYVPSSFSDNTTEIEKLKKVAALQQAAIKKILNSNHTLRGDKSFTGKVGVGTSNPKTNLHIHKGTSGAAIGDFGLLVENDDHAFIELASPATKKGILMFSPAGNETDGRISYNGSGVTPPNAMQFATGDGNPKMTIDSNGRVGIGTVNPTFASGGGLQIEHASRPNLKLQQASTATAEIFLEDALYINNISGNSIVFRTPGTTERMRINGHGNVGIGTADATPVGAGISRSLKIASSPSNQLNNAAGLQLLGYPNGSDDDAAIIDLMSSNSSNPNFGIGIARIASAPFTWGSSRLKFYTKNHLAGSSLTERLRIEYNGYVGIGTSNPQYLLHAKKVDGNSQSIKLSASHWASFLLESDNDSNSSGPYNGGIHLSGADGSMHFQVVNNHTKMVIGKQGYLGIGTSAPSAHLHVASPTTTYLQIQGEESRILFRTASGNRWQFISHTPSNQMQLYDHSDNSTAMHVVPGGTAWTTNSDARLKKNITDIEPWLDKFMDIKVRRFNWKKSNKPDLGFVAQELKPVFPEAVEGNEEDFYIDKDEQPQMAMGVTKTALIPILVKALQELNIKHEEEIAAQKALNQEKDSEIDVLKGTTEKLKAENEMLKDYLCEKDPEAPFCEQ